MKNLFISFGILSILSAVSLTAQSQANINLEKLNQKPVNKFSLRFIEDIELIPAGAGTFEQASNEEVITLPVAAKTKSPTHTISAIEKCESWQFKYAMLMDVEVETLVNSRLYSFIEEWWATRYRYGGTTKKGVDCSAFTRTLLNEVFGYTLPRTAREQFAVSQRIYNREDLKEGDMVFFNTSGGVSHVGVYLSNNRFVHSSVHDGVTISNLNDKYYNSKFICGAKAISTTSVNEVEVVAAEN